MQHEDRLTLTQGVHGSFDPACHDGPHVVRFAQICSFNTNSACIHTLFTPLCTWSLTLHCLTPPRKYQQQLQRQDHQEKRIEGRHTAEIKPTQHLNAHCHPNDVIRKLAQWHYAPQSHTHSTPTPPCHSASTLSHWSTTQYPPSYIIPQVPVPLHRKR